MKRGAFEYRYKRLELHQLRRGISRQTMRVKMRALGIQVRRSVELDPVDEN